jgi:hypothetical protein
MTTRAFFRKCSRQDNDPKSLGGLFFHFADEVWDLDFQTALQQLGAFSANGSPFDCSDLSLTAV